MSKRMQMFLFSGIGLFIVAFILFHYVLSIYETKFEQDHRELYADGISTVTIRAIAINAWGFKAPFRKGTTEYLIEEGFDKIDILRNDREKGILILRSKLVTGKVVIRAIPEKSLLPTSFEIEIFPNSAMEDSSAIERVKYMM